MPAQKPGVTCMIMAYNEEANLEQAVTEVREQLLRSGRPFEVLVVDDGSKDRTAAIGDTLAARWPEVRVIRHGQNRGPGSAIVTGVAEAKMPLYCFHPADNQVVFADICKALDLLDKDYDLLVGQRSDRRDYSGLRLLSSYTSIFLNRVLFGLPDFRDFNFVYLWRTDLVKPMLPLHSSGVFLCTEILIRARDAGARIGMAYAEYRPRVAGESTVGRPMVMVKTLGQVLGFFAKWKMGQVQPIPPYRAASGSSRAS